MTHLTKQDRCKTENLLNAKVSIKKIAKDLEKHHTTISREIKKRRVVDEASKNLNSLFRNRLEKVIFYDIYKQRNKTKIREEVSGFWGGH